MLPAIHRIRRDRRGATAIEYGLIAAIIALGLITALGSVRDNLSAKFDAVSAELAK
jgi:pilus assembly protein Flp/PilA